MRSKDGLAKARWAPVNQSEPIALRFSSSRSLCIKARWDCGLYEVSFGGAIWCRQLPRSVRDIDRQSPGIALITKGLAGMGLPS